MNHCDIGFIGGGNMARSIIGGLRAADAAVTIAVAEPDAARRATLADDFGVAVTADNAALAAAAATVILAVKPQSMSAACRDAAAACRAHRPLILSIAAGIRVADVRGWLGGSGDVDGGDGDVDGATGDVDGATGDVDGATGDVDGATGDVDGATGDVDGATGDVDGAAGNAADLVVVRAMPNTPALVQCGASALFADEACGADERRRAEEILRAVGTVCWVATEDLLDAVTAVSGSGPAYFFYLMEAMTAAAVQAGLPAATAQALTLQTARGAAALAVNEKDFAELRRRVTSPGGTTEAAMEILQARGFAETVTDAVHGAAKRAGELATEFGGR